MISIVIFQPVPFSPFWKQGGFLVSRTARAWFPRDWWCLCLDSQVTAEGTSVTAEHSESPSVTRILHVEEGLNIHSSLSFRQISLPWAPAFFHRTTGACIFGLIAPLTNLVRTSQRFRFRWHWSVERGCGCTCNCKTWQHRSHSLGKQG